MIIPATHGRQLSLLPHDGRTRAVHASEEHDVYAGRPADGSNPSVLPFGSPGWLGNPHTVGRECPICRRWHEVDEALVMFRAYFNRRVEYESNFRRAVLALRGKRLGCPGCATGSPGCHASLIARWIEENAK